MTEFFALRALIVMLSLLVIFHLLVLVKIVPFRVVWGSKMSGESEMYKLETIALLISLLMLAIVIVSTRPTMAYINRTVTSVLLWIMFCFFCLNTIGNLLSDNLFEKLVFAPSTFFMALFTFRVAGKKKLEETAGPIN